MSRSIYSHENVFLPKFLTNERESACYYNGFSWFASASMLRAIDTSDRALVSLDGRGCANVFEFCAGVSIFGISTDVYLLCMSMNALLTSSERLSCTVVLVSCLIMNVYVGFARCVLNIKQVLADYLFPPLAEINAITGESYGVGQ
jgi:hypothetical protein